MRTLALFDFDGTVTFKDTFLEFIKFAKGKKRFYAGFILLSPILIAMKAGLYPNWKAKERVLIHFFEGTPIKQFNSWGQEFARNIIPQMIRSQALIQLNKHQAQGDVVYIVSASPENWLIGWVKKHNLNLISTKLECVNSKITGRIDGKNCYGQEKVNRIKHDIELNKYDRIIAFGDSSGDKEMLAFADESYFKPFR